MHAATLEAPRLATIRDYLRERGARGATTLEIHDATGCCAVSTAVSELRRRGCTFEVEREGVTASGAKVFRYRLTGEPK